MESAAAASVEILHALVTSSYDRLGHIDVDWDGNGRTEADWGLCPIIYRPHMTH